MLNLEFLRIAKPWRDDDFVDFERHVELGVPWVRIVRHHGFDTDIQTVTPDQATRIFEIALEEGYTKIVNVFEN